MLRRTGPRALAFMTTPGRFAMPRPGASTYPFAFFVAANATVYVIKNHERVTPRKRSTSNLGRSCWSAAMVALTSGTGLFEPKLLVKIS